MGVSDNLDSLFNYVVIMELEMMRVAAPHIGVEPCAGAKTDVMGFPRVVVECLLALAQRTRGRAAIEIVDLYEVAKAVASEPPRGLHADGPADAGLEGLLGRFGRRGSDGRMRVPRRYERPFE